MMSAIGHNLRNLFTPHGRDGRRIFWPYFLFVVLLNILLLAAVATPPIAAVIGEVSANAKSVEAGALEAEVLREMASVGLAQRLVIIGIAIGFLNIVLLGGSLVRRSHDAGLPGAIVFVPLALQLIWMYFASSQLANIETTVQLAAEAREAGKAAAIEPAMIAQDLLGWVVVLIAIAIGMAKSQPGANQYGEGPTKP